MISQLLILITNLLFFTAQCSDAYTPPTPRSHHHHHHRWSTSTRLLSTTTSSVDGTTTATTTPTSAEEEENNITTRDLLSLDYIRSTLIRQEETIIFALIERSQFRQNPICYEPGGIPGLGVPPGSRSDGREESEEEFSFLDFMFTGTVCFLFDVYISVLLYLWYHIILCSNRFNICKNKIYIKLQNTPFSSHRKHFTASCDDTNRPKNMPSSPPVYPNVPTPSLNWIIHHCYRTIRQLMI